MEQLQPCDVMLDGDCLKLSSDDSTSSVKPEVDKRVVVQDRAQTSLQYSGKE